LANAARASLLELLLCWKLLVDGSGMVRVLELICNSSLAYKNPYHHSISPLFCGVCVFVADTELGRGVAQSRCAGLDLSE
jgi:hypothetical protein